MEKIGFALAVVVIFVLFFGGVLIPDRAAVKIATDEHYSDARVIGSAWLGVEFRGCGWTDHVRFTVEANDEAGRRRVIYVCVGLFQGRTFRAL